MESSTLQPYHVLALHATGKSRVFEAGPAFTR
jgi:hypothetical protein